MKLRFEGTAPQMMTEAAWPLPLSETAVVILFALRKTLDSLV